MKLVSVFVAITYSLCLAQSPFPAAISSEASQKVKLVERNSKYNPLWKYPTQRSRNRRKSFRIKQGNRR